MFQDFKRDNRIELPSVALHELVERATKKVCKSEDFARHAQGVRIEIKPSNLVSVLPGDG